jgi:hypothetical protein
MLGGVFVLLYVASAFLTCYMCLDCFLMGAFLKWMDEIWGHQKEGNIIWMKSALDMFRMALNY